MNKGNNQVISRSQMLSWINRTLNVNQTRIENLGNGVIYCMLLNHYHPSTIPPSKIINFPRSYQQYRTNLKRFQEGLASIQMKGIVFDVFKVAQMTYYQNWNLICKVHKYFSNLQSDRTCDISKENRDLRRQISFFQTKSESPLPQFGISNSFNSILMNPLVASMNPMATPIKSKQLEENKARIKSMSMIQQIKKIVTQGSSDRLKVTQLKQLLGLHSEECQDEDMDHKDLLSDYKKKEQVIDID